MVVDAEVRDLLLCGVLIRQRILHRIVVEPDETGVVALELRVQVVGG